MRIGSAPLLWAAGLAAIAAALLGCQHAGLSRAHLTPSERLELETRALGLLLRAAEGDKPDVACNAIEALVRVAPRDGLPLFRKAAQSPSPIVCYAGLVALGELRDRDSLPAMRAAAGAENAHVRLAAAFAAARCGHDGYVRILVRALSDAAEENVRADAAGLLGRLGDPRARGWLAAALNVGANRKSKPVTLAIHGALAMLGDRNSLQELINYSQGDPASRSVALLLLADLGQPDAREALRYRLLSPTEEYDEARLIAARGLGKLGDREGLDLALRKLTFKDPNPNPSPENPDRTYPVRSMAVHALAEIGDPRAIPALREIAATSTDPRLQVAAAYALCKLVRTTPAP